MNFLTSSITLILTASIVFSCGCSEDINKNTVNPEQVEIDNSTNYRYIFKDRIEKEKKIKEREIENEFHREEPNEK